MNIFMHTWKFDFIKQLIPIYGCQLADFTLKYQIYGKSIVCSSPCFKVNGGQILMMLNICNNCETDFSLFFLIIVKML